MCAWSLKISRKWREINKSRNDTRLEHLFSFRNPLGELFGVLPAKSVGLGMKEGSRHRLFILNSRHKCFHSIAWLLVRPVIVDRARYLVNIFTLQPSKRITGTRCREQTDSFEAIRLFAQRPTKSQRSAAARLPGKRRGVERIIAFENVKKTLIKNSMEMFELAVPRSETWGYRQTPVFSWTLSYHKSPLNVFRKSFFQRRIPFEEWKQLRLNNGNSLWKGCVLLLRQIWSEAEDYRCLWEWKQLSLRCKLNQNASS